MPGLARVGRNEPCPCGSGRKYKVCCLPRDEAFETARDGATALTQILLRAIPAPDVLPAVERLWERYWPDRPPKTLKAAWDAMTGSEQEGPEADVTPFLVWVVHGAPLEGLLEKATARLGLGSAGAPVSVLDIALSGYDQPPQTPGGAIIEAFRNNVASAFQVVRRQPGRRVWLRDVFSDEIFEVGDRNLSENGVTGEVLITRLRPLEGLYEAVGSAWRFPATEVHALRPWGETQLSRFREFEPEAGWRRLWRERWELLHHYVVQERRNPTLPTVFTTTGEPLRFCRTQWRVRDAVAVAAALDDHQPELQRDGDEPKWTWVPVPGDARWVQRTPEGKAEAPHARLFPGGPALGHITLDREEGRLTLETMSAERAEAGRALLESLAGAHLTFLREDRRSPHEALAERAESGGAHGVEPPPAVLQQATEAFFADYERRWLDMTIPALGGKTPRQAAASADPLLRRRLQDLLLEFEEAESREQQAPGDVRMSVARLRRMLGLSGDAGEA